MTKQEKKVSIVYWALMLSWVVGVYIQHDETSTQEAGGWLIFTVVIYVVAIAIQLIRKKYKAQ